MNTFDALTLGVMAVFTILANRCMFRAIFTSMDGWGDVPRPLLLGIVAPWHALDTFETACTHARWMPCDDAYRSIIAFMFVYCAVLVLAVRIRARLLGNQ